MGCECRVSLGYTVRSYLKKGDLEKDNQKKKITVYPSVPIWLGYGKDPPGLCSQEASGEALGYSGLLPGGLGPLRTVLPADLGPPRTVLLGGLRPLTAAPRRPWDTQSCSQETLGYSGLLPGGLGLLRAAPRWPLDPHSSLSLAHFFFMVILLLL